MQDLTMADQSVLLHCWTNYNQDHIYVSILEVFKLHKFTLLYLFTYVDARGGNGQLSSRIKIWYMTGHSTSIEI